MNKKFYSFFQYQSMWNKLIENVSWSSIKCPDIFFATPTLSSTTPQLPSQLDSTQQILQNTPIPSLSKEYCSSSLS